MALTLFRPGDRPVLHLSLLAATFFTTFGTFALAFSSSPDLHGRLLEGLVFSVCLVSILGAHEMGHYVLARIHGVDTSLPYFIPLPLLGVGTIGAVIRIRSPIPSRNALVDIGAAGPLAGLAVALPILIAGYLRAPYVVSPELPTQFEGETSLWGVTHHVAHWLINRLTGVPSVHAPDPGLVAYCFGDNLLLKALERVLLGAPPPGMTLSYGPMLVAGWFGLLVTMLNLIPIGQLDGGHLTFAVFGKRARVLGMAMAAGVLFLAIFYSAGWTVWFCVAVGVVGFRHQEVVVPSEPLSPGRAALCALCLIALVLCVMPVPISLVALSGAAP